MPGVSTREMPDSTGEGQVDSCSLLLLIDYLSSGIKIVSLCVRHLLKENFSNPFCDNSLSLPVEEWRAKLGQRRKLFLWVHNQGVSWNYCTRRALAYNDEPEKGEGMNWGMTTRNQLLRNIKKVWKCNNSTCLSLALVQLACLESPERLFDVFKCLSASAAKCWPGGWDSESWRISLCCTAL